MFFFQNYIFFFFKLRIKIFIYALKTFLQSKIKKGFQLFDPEKKFAHFEILNNLKIELEKRLKARNNASHEVITLLKPKII